MKKIKMIFSALILLLSSYLFANDFPSIEPSVTINFTEENFSPEQLFLTAMEFSLCSQNDELGKTIITKYKEMEKVVKSSEFTKLPEIERGEKVLKYIHDELLKKYEEGTASMTVTFSTGSYNCVTSSILFLCLAKAAGLNVKGQKTNIHALCSVYINDKKIDVETTNYYGFNPGERKTIEKTENSHRYTYVPKKYYAGRKEISDKAFVTLTGKNIVSELNDTNEYNGAIPLAASRLDFLKTENQKEILDVRADFDTVVTNYAINLTKQNKTLEAIDFLEQVENRWGSSGAISKTYFNAVYNTVVNYLNSGDVANAKKIYEQKKNNIQNDNASKILKNINRFVEVEYHNKFADAINSKNLEQAKEVLEEALKELPNSQVLKKDLNYLNSIK